MKVVFVLVFAFLEPHRLECKVCSILRIEIVVGVSCYTTNVPGVNEVDRLTGVAQHCRMYVRDPAYGVLE